LIGKKKKKKNKKKKKKNGGIHERNQAAKRESDTDVLGWLQTSPSPSDIGHNAGQSQAYAPVTGGVAVGVQNSI